MSPEIGDAAAPQKGHGQPRVTQLPGARHEELPPALGGVTNRKVVLRPRVPHRLLQRRAFCFAPRDLQD